MNMHNKRSLQHDNDVTQAETIEILKDYNIQRKISKEWENYMPSKALIDLLRNIILKNGSKTSITDLTLTELKLILSYIVNAKDYEYYCENATRMYAAFSEFKDHIQELINQEINEMLYDAISTRSLVNADDYEYFSENFTRMWEGIREFKGYIQNLLDAECVNFNKGGF